MRSLRSLYSLFAAAVASLSVSAAATAAVETSKASFLETAPQCAAGMVVKALNKSKQTGLPVVLGFTERNIKITPDEIRFADRDGAVRAAATFILDANGHWVQSSGWADDTVRSNQVINNVNSGTAASCGIGSYAYGAVNQVAEEASVISNANAQAEITTANELGKTLFGYAAQVAESGEDKVYNHNGYTVVFNSNLLRKNADGELQGSILVYKRGQGSALDPLMIAHVMPQVVDGNSYAISTFTYRAGFNPDDDKVTAELADGLELVTKFAHDQYKKNQQTADKAGFEDYVSLRPDAATVNFNGIMELNY